MATKHRVSRRTFLKTTGAAAGTAAMAGFPASVRGQAKEILIGAVHPVTGIIAEIGQNNRRGVQLAVEEINAKGGVKSMGGARLKLLTGDSESKPEAGRAEAERLIREGAVLLTGAFQSPVSAAIAPLAEQRRIPFVIDISAADNITRQGYKYTFRNFPTGSNFAQKMVEFTREILAQSKVAPKRAVLIHISDLFGKVQADGFLKAHQGANLGFEVVEVISYAPETQDLSNEVAKLKAARPDLVMPICRGPRDATMLMRELFKQRVEMLGIMNPGSPGFYEVEAIQQMGKLAEFVLDNLPWINPVSPMAKGVKAAFEAKFPGKRLDTNSGYSYEVILIIADALERARSAEADKLVDALRKTNIKDHIMVGGPIVFDERGDNPNASTAMVQILGGQPKVVLPGYAAEGKLVFPAPKLWERG